MKPVLLAFTLSCLAALPPSALQAADPCDPSKIATIVVKGAQAEVSFATPEIAAEAAKTMGKGYGVIAVNQTGQATVRTAVSVRLAAVLKSMGFVAKRGLGIGFTTISVWAMQSGTGYASEWEIAPDFRYVSQKNFQAYLYRQLEGGSCPLSLPVDPIDPDEPDEPVVPAAPTAPVSTPAGGGNSNQTGVGGMVPGVMAGNTITVDGNEACPAGFVPVQTILVWTCTATGGNRTVTVHCYTTPKTYCRPNNYW